MRVRPSAIRWLALAIAIVVIGTLHASTSQAANAPPPRDVDAQRAAAAGIRELTGQHIRLFTDLPSSPAVDELPAVFDAAIPLWAKYFELDERSVRGKFVGFLISDREKFAALGLLPEENRDFANGYNRNYEFWLVEQPSDYYRRHLLLHEGTHAFMQTQLGGAGAGWYMEGMAELLGTHRWKDGQLELGVMPASKDDVPMWGRVKIIRDSVKAGKPWPIAAVLEVDNRRQLDTEHYAWTWALAAMLDGDERCRERFRSLKKFVVDPEFNNRFRELFADDALDLMLDWKGFVSQLDYGYNVPQMAMTHLSTKQLGGAPSKLEVSAKRGWQSTGWALEAGKTYAISAEGAFHIADDGQPWPCEANGVTIEYHDGHPLGVLLGAIEGRGQNPRDPSFLKPLAIGRQARIQPQGDGVLYLRLNDHPAKLGDNAGSVDVMIVPAD